MDYEDRRINFDSYYDPLEGATYHVTIWVEPESGSGRAAIMAYMDANACTEEAAALALIEAGFTALLKNDALKLSE